MAERKLRNELNRLWVAAKKTDEKKESARRIYWEQTDLARADAEAKVKIIDLKQQLRDAANVLQKMVYVMEEKDGQYSQKYFNALKEKIWEFCADNGLKIQTDYDGVNRRGTIIVYWL